MFNFLAHISTNVKKKKKQQENDSSSKSEDNELLDDEAQSSEKQDYMPTFTDHFHDKVAQWYLQSPFIFLTPGNKEAKKLGAF